MRVLFFTNRPYLPQKVGGAESSTHAMIRALEGRGNSCLVLCGLLPDGLISLKNRVKRKLLKKDAPIDNVMGYRVARAWNAVAAILEIKSLFSPDVAVLLPSDGGMAKLATPLNDESIPTVLHLRDVQFDSLGDPTTEPLAGIIANSHFTADAFEQKYSIKPDVVYNIIDREAYKTKAKGKYVTFINPVSKKGKDLAFYLAEQNPDIPFLFVEGWKLSTEQKKLILERVQKSQNIVWMDRTQDMTKVYSKTRVLIVPSQWEEAWGRVVSEAHVAGIPVLASQIGGLPESVGIGGKLIEPDDVEGWHNGLRAVWDDEEMWARLSANAYEYGRRQELDVGAIVEKYENLLKLYVES